MLTHKIKVALAVALVFGGAAAFATIGWQVRDWQHDAAELASIKAQEQTRELLHELASKVSASTEAAVSNIRIENRTIYQKAVHEIERETVYRDCVLPAAGRVLINDARAAANAYTSPLPKPSIAK